MPVLRVAAPALLAAALAAGSPGESSRQLTFEQRVAGSLMKGDSQ